MSINSVRVALLLATLSAACGDPLAPGDFLGDSRMHLEGIVCGTEGKIPSAQPTVGVLWKWLDRGEAHSVLPRVTTIPTESYPAYFATDIYDLPPVEESNVFMTADGPVTADVGCPVMFDDVDGDGAFGAGDTIMAVAWDQLVLYVRGDRPTAEASTLPLTFETDAPMRPGYRLLEGACEGDGPSDRLRTAAPDSLVNISVLEKPGVMPESPPVTCIHFF